MPRCTVCNNEVIISPYVTYVYVHINVGSQGKEKPLYLHYKCFREAIKKRGKLGDVIGKINLEILLKGLS